MKLNPQLIDFLKPFVQSYPWAAFLAVWFVFALGTYLEYRANKNNNVAKGAVLFLFGFLTFAVTQINTFGVFGWLLALCVIIAGLLIINKLKVH